MIPCSPAGGWCRCGLAQSCSTRRSTGRTPLKVTHDARNRSSFTTLAGLVDGFGRERFALGENGPLNNNRGHPPLGTTRPDSVTFIRYGNRRYVLAHRISRGSQGRFGVTSRRPSAVRFQLRFLGLRGNEARDLLLDPS